MSARIKFTGDGEDYKSGGHDADIVHSEGAGGNDYTLCGLTLDGDDGTAGSFKTTEKPITCEHCLQIIKFCKAIKIKGMKNETHT